MAAFWGRENVEINKLDLKNNINGQWETKKYRMIYSNFAKPIILTNYLRKSDSSSECLLIFDRYYMSLHMLKDG